MLIVHVLKYKSETGCSKLTTSLANALLKFPTLITEILQYFFFFKCRKLFYKKKKKKKKKNNRRIPVINVGNFGNALEM